MNIRPLTCMEGYNQENQVLTSGMIMWGKNCMSLKGIDLEEIDPSEMQRRLSWWRLY